jgi:hypothetical protein
VLEKESRSTAIRESVGATNVKHPEERFCNHRSVVLLISIAIAFAFFVMGMVHTHVTVSFRLRLISISGDLNRIIRLDFIWVCR